MVGRCFYWNFSSSLGEPIKPKGSSRREQKSEYSHETGVVINEREKKG